MAPDCLERLLAAARRAARRQRPPQIRFDVRRDIVNSAGLEVDVRGIGSDRLAGRGVDDPAVKTPADVFGATACVAVYRRAMLDAIGGFDASFFATREDADVAWRARMAGWDCRYQPARTRMAPRVGHRRRRRAQVPARGPQPRPDHRQECRSRPTGCATARACSPSTLAYVAFVALTDRTPAPLQGRVLGLREWRRYRAAGAATRGPVRLARGGWRASLRQRAAYRAAGGS